MPYWTIYYWISAVVCFGALLRHRSRLPWRDDLIGSIILSIGLGFALWPFAIAAVVKQRWADDATQKTR